MVMGKSGSGAGEDTGIVERARTGDNIHAVDVDGVVGSTRTGKRVRLGFAVPFVILLALALFLSSQPYPEQSLAPWLSSDSVSERLAYWLEGVRFAWNGEEMSVQSMGAHNLAEFILRKSAHLLIYAALSFALLLAFWMLLPWRKGISVALTVLLVTVLAFFDEYNQQFSEGRTPSLADVGIDLIGAALGLILFWFIEVLRQIRSSHDPSTGR